MSKIYILYHANCLDGAGAKFAAWKKYGNKAEYIAVNYKQAVPEFESNSEIYILDFSYPRDVLEGLQAAGHKVVIRDHHVTAKEALEGLPGAVFDMDKSGAVMAWEYFHPNTPVPQLLLHIQDRDLWKFKLPGTKEINMAIPLMEWDMLMWNDVVLTDIGTKLPGEPLWTTAKLKLAGEVLEQSNQQKIKSALKSKVKIIKFLGYEIGITNTGELGSEIGNAIYDSKDLNVDFAITYCISPKDEVFFSLRSKGAMDVRKIAEKFGGGGHVNASGFVSDLPTLFKILKGELSEVRSL